MEKPIVTELLLDGVNKDALLREIEKKTVYKSSASTPFTSCSYYELSCNDISFIPCEFVPDLENGSCYQEIMMYECLDIEVV